MSNNSYSSFINDKKETFPYIEFIKRILFKDLELHDAQILVLGAGGFTLSAEEAHSNYFTYVDIDPKIKSIVEKNFLEKIWMTVLKASRTKTKPMIGKTATWLVKNAIMPKVAPNAIDPVSPIKNRAG